MRNQTISYGAVKQNANGGEWLQFVGFISFLILGFVFVILSNRDVKKSQSKLISLKEILGNFQIGKSFVSCYAGNISFISEADIVVTSENTSLDLGSISGTSVSGRIRKLAATKNQLGDITSDNLGEFLRKWKNDLNCHDNFNLGQVIFTPITWSAIRNNIKCIALSVSIRNTPDGHSILDPIAIADIISKVLRHAEENNFVSIFFPIFGLGSGGIASDLAISTTVSALAEALRNEKISFKIYLGVYREVDKIELYLRIKNECLNISGPI